MATTIPLNSKVIRAYNTAVCAARPGALKAITATVHELARPAYRMLKFGQQYVDESRQFYSLRSQAV